MCIFSMSVLHTANPYFWISSSIKNIHLNIHLNIQRVSKKTDFKTKKGGITTSCNTPIILKLLLLAFSRLLSSIFPLRSARNERRLLYYSLFGAYSPLIDNPAEADNSSLRPPVLPPSKQKINGRYTTKIPVFPLCSSIPCVKCICITHITNNICRKYTK